MQKDPTVFDDTRAVHYDARHRRNWLARMVTRRERVCVASGLRDAGSPSSALDLPCGTGRFWPAFQSAGIEDLKAADNSASMLHVADRNRAGVAIRVELLNCSAFSIALPDDSVEIATCLRFFHHLSMPPDRRKLLAELTRVSRSGKVLLSTMVCGNVVGMLKRRRRRHVPPTPGYGRRFVREAAEVEAEFRDYGFSILQHYDSFPRIDCWRFYLLQGRKS